MDNTKYTINSDNNKTFDNFEFYCWIQNSISRVMSPIDDFHSVCFNPVETIIEQNNYYWDSDINEDDYYIDPYYSHNNYIDDEFYDSDKDYYSDNNVDNNVDDTSEDEFELVK